MQKSSRTVLALVLLAPLPLAGACSSSDSPATAGSLVDGGDAASMATIDAAEDVAVVDSAMPLDASSSSAPCRYAVSGDRTEPTTDAPSCPGHLEQVSGSGDFTLNVAAGYGTSADGNFALALTLSSQVAPKAGDVWTLAQDGRTGNVSLTVTKGSTATIWAVSDTATNVTAGQKAETKITFGTVTMTHGVQHPADVYYFFDATFETTLFLQPGGTSTVKVSGHLAESTLPFGS